MTHGGRRESAGRPAGARNKRTAAREAETRKVAAVIEAAIGEPFTGDAHAFLMTIYKDPKMSTDLRVDAAKAAIRYEKPALATIDLTSVNEHLVHDISSEPMSDEEWEAKHCGTGAKASDVQ